MNYIPPPSKTSIPQINYKVIRRRRLFELLDNCLKRRLTVVCAGAGYGKTTLVSSWLMEKGIPAVWITLDDEDQDFIKLTNFLVSGLERYIPGINDRYSHLEPDLSFQSVKPIILDLIELIYSSGKEIIIVLDDFHQIKSRKIFDAIELLINSAPQNLHIIIISRRVLPFGLSHWRIRDYLLEISINELRCTEEEAYEFLSKVMQQSLDRDSAKLLNDTAEGWITGLKLSSLGKLDERSINKIVENIKGGSRYITDYLMDEVFKNQPEEVKEFLIKTSIMDPLCAGLCEAIGVTNEGSCQSVIEELENENIFIYPLDDHRTWYRYHQLFREFLERKLEMNHPGLVNNLYQKAANWFKDNSMIELAISHYLSGKNYEQAALIILKNLQKLQHEGRNETFLRWLKQFPEEKLYDYPELVINYISLLFYNSEFTKAQRIGDHIKVSRLYSSLQGEAQTQFLIRFHLLRGTLASRSLDIAGMEEAIKEVEHLVLPTDYKHIAHIMLLKGIIYETKEDPEKMEDAYRSAFMLTDGLDLTFMEAYASKAYLANHLFAKGFLNRAKEVSRDAVDQIIIDEGLKNLTGVQHLILGGCLYYQGDLLNSADHINNGLDMIQEDYEVLWHLDGYYLLALISHYTGNHDEILSLLNKLDRVFADSGDKHLVAHHYRGLMARLHITLGKFEEAHRWIEGFNPHSRALVRYRYHDFNRPFIYTLGFDRITYARYLISIYKNAEALLLLQEWLPDFRHDNRAEELIEILILSGIASFHQRNIDLSRTYILEAISSSYRENFIQLFLNDLALLLPILENMKSHYYSSKAMIAPEELEKEIIFINEVISHFEEQHDMSRILPIGLTVRETEILLQISNGLPNEEIAQKLFISTNTLRTHIKNIYRKLNANSRVHAIFRAKETGLIP